MNNWDNLRFFLAVTDSGSVKAAAQTLGVNQATVFRRLRSLEKNLNTGIFDHRKHGQYQLTTAGENLLVQVRLIEDAMWSIERNIQGRDLQLSGTVRVTTAEDIASVLLPRHLLEFNKAYPEITVELLTDNRYFNLAQGEADVAIRPVESSTEALIIPCKICSISYSFFASLTYLQREGTPQSKSELHNHRIIMWSGSFTDRDLEHKIKNLTDKAGRHAPIVCNSLLTQFAMTEIGLGISFLPDFLGKQNDKLVRILPDNRFDSGFLWGLYHEDLRKSSRVRAFVDFMIESIRKDPYLQAE